MVAAMVASQQVFVLTSLLSIVSAAQLCCLVYNVASYEGTARLQFSLDRVLARGSRCPQYPPCMPEGGHEWPGGSRLSQYIRSQMHSIALTFLESDCCSAAISCYSLCSGHPRSLQVWARVIPEGAEDHNARPPWPRRVGRWRLSRSRTHFWERIRVLLEGAEPPPCEVHCMIYL